MQQVCIWRSLCDLQLCCNTDAQEEGDAWAMCLLSWLQGQPGTALQWLMPQEEPEQASGSSTDRSIIPGQLGTAAASTSAWVQSSSSHRPHAPQGSAVETEARPDCSEAVQWSLALELVSCCLSASTPGWPGRLPSLQQLLQLAVQAAHCLEAEGHHVMALEAHQVASMCQQRLATSGLQQQRPQRQQRPPSRSSPQAQAPAQTDSSVHQQQQQQVFAAWYQRLVTASLLRCLVDTTHPSHATPLLEPLASPPGPVNPTDAQHLLSQRWTLHRNKGLSPAPKPSQSGWRKLAQQQLQLLLEAGLEVDGEATMQQLQAVHNSLMVSSMDVHQEDEGALSPPAGLMHSISGMSALSTPRKNSTLSR